MAEVMDRRAAMAENQVAARKTEMGQSRDELNLGHLCREHRGEQARLIGFGTHDGTVAAATDRGGATAADTAGRGRRRHLSFGALDGTGCQRRARSSHRGGVGRTALYAMTFDDRAIFDEPPDEVDHL